MQTYLFFGRIIPERIPLTLPRHTRPLKHMDGRDFATLEVDVTAGQVSAILRCSEALDNLVTARTVAREFCRVPINAFAFCNGVGYELELTKGIHLESGTTETFGVSGHDFIAFAQESCAITPETALDACDSREGRLLQYALEDLTDAIRIGGRHRAFLCYRAIESARNYHAEAQGVDRDRRAECWDLLRTQTGTPREDIDFVKQFADDVRHGDSTSYSDAEASRMLKIAWLILHQTIQQAADRPGSGHGVSD